MAQQPPPGSPDVFTKGLPNDPMAERLVLGAALLNPEHLASVLTALTAESFFTENNRRIFSRMLDLFQRGDKVDRITLAHELTKQGQIESVGGFTYICSLDDGLPELVAIDSYVRIVKEQANLRRLAFTGQKMVDQALMAGQTPDEILAAIQPILQEIEGSTETKGDGGATPLEVVEQFEGGPAAFLDPSIRKKGLPTGFTKFDEMTGGLHPKQVIVIGARTGQGKSSLAMNIAEHLILHPKLRKYVAFFSLEMSAESILTRMACTVARVDQMRFRNGYLNEEERHRLQVALFNITEANFRIYDTAGITVPEIAKRVRRLVKDEGLHLAVIDYLQILGAHGRQDNRTQEISQMTRQVKMLASECDIPIILISQLSRSGDKRADARPQLSDLRDSSSIENDADVVALLYREEAYKRDREDLRGLAELNLIKQRNGPTSVIELRWLAQYTSFHNKADDLPEG